MNIQENIPIVLYDDQCYLCTKFARVVNFISKGKLAIIGHYSNQGVQIRNQLLDGSALEMFWLIDENMAYGGRAAIFPLIFAMFKSKKKQSSKIKFQDNCTQECKTVKSVFIRSASLLSNSKKIKLK
ncbi:MAG: hypothetical protein P8X83_01235 [Nitrosopumilaceae archaeon]|jgi:hypothetical protein